MVKLNANLFQYLEDEDFRVLAATPGLAQTCD